MPRTARSKSTDGSKSPVKKSASGKSPARHTTPRKKSKTPSRKGSTASAAPKSPVKRGRSRSKTPRKTPATKRKSTSKSPPKRSPSVKSSASRTSKKSDTPRSTAQRGRSTSRGRGGGSGGGARSRSSSKSSTSSRGRGGRSPLQQAGRFASSKISQAADVIDHKIVTPVKSFAHEAVVRSRRAAHEAAIGRFNSAGSGGTTSSVYLRHHKPQTILKRITHSRPAQFVRSVPRRLRYTNLKRHIKRNWRRYLTAAALVGLTYLTMQNRRVVEKALNEQYNKLAALVQHQHQKGLLGSLDIRRYFSGWLGNETDEGVSTTTTPLPPPTMPPHTVDQQQVPQPQHHATKTIGT